MTKRKRNKIINNMKTSTANVLSVETGFGKIAILSLMVLIFSMSIIYAYFVNSTVMNVVERGNVEDKIASVNTRVSELEFEYINSKNRITFDLAESVGFVEKKNVNYISSKVSDTSISLSSGVR